MGVIRLVGVVGAGTMGHGIALVAASHGFKVIMRDVDEKLVARAMERIGTSLSKAVEKGELGEDEKDAALSRISGTTRLDDLRDCGILIEAIPEDLELKKELLGDLDRICGPDAILASNTSTLSITELASATGRPGQFIGMHFVNPVPVMSLVEVVRGLRTSDETARTVVSLAEKLGKVPVEVMDSPGFVLNRLLMPMLNEAVWCLMEGVASKEEIDQAMRLGANHPMGPLELADLIGVDICLRVMEILYRDLSDPKYAPCPLLRRMVGAGWLGRKAGKGFYDY